MKPKVYFAKSNLCNPERIAEIRLSLKQLDIDLVEFKGGEYSTKDLLSSDYLIVCPYEDDLDFKGCIIGKGLYKQILDFDDQDKTLIILPGNNKRILFTKYECIDLNDEDDWKRTYGSLMFEDKESNWLTSIFKLKENNKTVEVSNKNKYLLITK
jgi:hypothetical protein